MKKEISIVIGGVSLIRHSIDRKRFLKICTEVGNNFEDIITGECLFKGTRIKWIGLILRLGDTLSDVVYSEINTKDGGLPLAIEVPAFELEGLSEDELTQTMTKIVLHVLLDVAKKYELDTKALKVRTEELYGA